MENKPEYICINNHHYQKDSLKSFWTNNDKSSSNSDIYAFLQKWFDDSEEIIANTSGSTGKPKVIKLTKAAMRNSARMTNAFFGLDASKTALLCLPASYIAGKMMLLRAIVGGFNILTVEPQANPFANLNIEIDFAAITPYQLNHSVETLKLLHIKNIIVGGGHVDTKLENQAAEIPASLYETYGMTETASHIALRCFNGENKSDFFTTLAGVNISQDKRGCLIIDAPHLSNTPLITNDVVEIRDERTFRWLGRADSVINSGGIKLFPEQIEKKLETIIVSNFFVSSLPDDTLGEKLILVIESTQLPAHLPEILQTILSKYEIPKEIYCIENFQYSISNKILKKETIKKITG
jgi:O-succinylbenzoic acid--CoA ligase